MSKYGTPSEEFCKRLRGWWLSGDPRARFVVTQAVGFVTLATMVSLVVTLGWWGAGAATALFVAEVEALYQVSERARRADEAKRRAQIFCSKRILDRRE